MTIETKAVSPPFGLKSTPRSTITPHEKITYRDDLDGMRGVSVIGVIVYHYFPNLAPGSFTSVEVFFVVSGFLITGMILQDTDRGRFSLRQFYLRRARRLFPSLIAVLTAVLAAGWALLYSEEFRNLGKYTFAGASYIMNFALMRGSTYFDEDSHLKPLLHLWTLAVEEQFYFFMPLLLLLVFRRRSLLIGALTVALVASMALNLYLAATNPLADFFLPFSRFWEMLAPGLLAAIGLDRIRKTKLPAVFYSLLGGAGLAIVVGGYFLASDTAAYPGALAALPVAGTVMVIAAGRDALVNRTVLSFEPLVWIGRICYPLYLWHWPLISFAIIIVGDTPSVTTRIALLIAAVGLAQLTYRFVELPVRKRPATNRQGLTLVSLLALLAVAGVAIWLVPGMRTAPDAQNSGRPIATWTYWTNDTCLKRYPNTEAVHGWWFCVTNADAKPDILLLGDSRANQLFPGIVAAPGLDTKTVLSIGTCFPLRNTLWKPDGVRTANPCIGDRALPQSRFLDRVIDDSNPKYTILNTVWPSFDVKGRYVDHSGDPMGGFIPSPAQRGVTSEEAFRSGLLDRIATLEAAGSKVILFLPQPELDFPLQLCFDRPLRQDVQACTIPRSEAETRRASFVEFARQLSAAHPGITLYDPFDALCTDKTCSLVRDGEALMRDNVHLSEAGAHVVANDFAQWAQVNAPEIIAG